MVFQPIPYNENIKNWIIVAMAKAEWGKMGKTSKNRATSAAIVRSMRGESEKSRAFFIVSIRTVPWVEPLL